jgi:Xaa-Pro aminopeptidase
MPDSGSAPIDDTLERIAGVDLALLRSGRLGRLQAAMRAHDVEACCFFNQANVRYATGTAVMTVYSSGNFVRCAVVPAEGPPVLFEHPKALHISGRIVDDVRPMPFWEFTDDPRIEARSWARQIVSAMRETGARTNRLAVDRLGTPAFLALAEEGIEVVDSGALTLDAREVKTPEEIGLIEANADVGVGMLSAFEEALRPGIRERELLSIITDVILRRGGEYLISRACVSGPNTNPWNLEATDRPVETDDLVFVDTDAYGIEGYLIDVSRTFLCGEGTGNDRQRDAYRAAHAWLMGARELVVPGITTQEFARRAPRLPEEYLAQRYEVMVHSAGLEDEGPSVAYPEDPQPNPDRVLREGMVLCLEVYAGEVGGRDGVKLEDQVLVTGEGSRTLIPYSYCEALL